MSFVYARAEGISVEFHFSYAEESLTEKVCEALCYKTDTNKQSQKTFKKKKKKSIYASKKGNEFNVYN